MKKFLSLLLVLVFIIVMLSACKNDEVALESCSWKMESVVSLDKNGETIAVGEKTDIYPNAKVIDIILVAQDGELRLEDKTNGETYNGAYEEMLVTDSPDDYKIFLDGKEGYINSTKTVYPDKSETPMLIVTVDNYDIYFHQVKGE